MNTRIYLKINFALIFSLLLFAPFAKLFAQAPPILWQRCYGGSNQDYINCIKQTSDGGYIAAGGTLSTDGDLAGNGGITGLWVLKLDPFGSIQWEKTYSDTLNFGYYIEPTLDGGYILKAGGATGAHIIKLNKDGNVEWIDNIISASNVHQTSDSGYIVCAYFPALIKLNADGSIAWSVNNMSIDEDPITINDVCQSYTGGYIIIGSIYDIYSSPYIGKTDDAGHLLFPGDDYSHGVGYLLCKTNDGNYLASSIGHLENSLSKINDSCIAYWNENVTDIAFPSIINMAPMMNNGALACGSSSTGADMEVVAYDSAGNFLWAKDMGGSMEDAANSVLQAANGNYVAAGYTFSNDRDVSGNHGGEDGWIVEFGTNVSVPVVNGNQGEIKAYPIPANDVIYIDLPKGYENATLKLVDISGKTAPVKEDNNGLSRTLYLNGLATGEYLLEVIDNGNYNSKKIIHY